MISERLRKTFDKGRTYVQLGFANVVTVFFYRLIIRLRRVQRIMDVPRKGSTMESLFRNSVFSESKNIFSTTVIKEADNLIKGTFCCFSHPSYFYGTPPDWFLNPFNQKRYYPKDRHWFVLGDFDCDIGDIKCIWEVSRFDWVLVLVRAYCQSGKQEYLSKVNNWIGDWYEQNPPYKGPNWKCGQEVGIRMMQVLMAASILGQDKKPTTDLIHFIQEHAARIAPTIRYAIAQDNNHGTSEAAALFVAGSWLLTLDSEQVDNKQARCWQKKGRKWLENRMREAIVK